MQITDFFQYYDQKLSMSEILAGEKVQPGPAAKVLAEKIEQYAKSDVARAFPPRIANRGEGF